jgi:hypothetical protein
MLTVASMNLAELVLYAQASMKNVVLNLRYISLVINSTCHHIEIRHNLNSAHAYLSA